MTNRSCPTRLHVGQQSACSAAQVDRWDRQLHCGAAQKRWFSCSAAVLHTYYNGPYGTACHTCHILAAGVVGGSWHCLRHGQPQLSVALTCSAGATKPEAGRQPADAERRPLPTAGSCRPQAPPWGCSRPCPAPRSLHTKPHQQVLSTCFPATPKASLRVWPVQGGAAQMKAPGMHRTHPPGQAPLAGARQIASAALDVTQGGPCFAVRP